VISNTGVYQLIESVPVIQGQFVWLIYRWLLFAWCRIFLLVQLLSIVNFVYIWNESWISPENERQWYVM
jgi:hypothetical protein